MDNTTTDEYRVTFYFAPENTLISTQERLISREHVAEWETTMRRAFPELRIVTVEHCTVTRTPWRAVGGMTDEPDPMIKIVQLAVVSSMIDKDYTAAAEILHDLKPPDIYALINACNITAAFARAEVTPPRQ